jgi:hypothetical protein
VAEEIGIGPDTGASVFIDRRRRGHHRRGREGVQLRRAVGHWQLLLRGGAGSGMQRGSSSESVALAVLPVGVAVFRSLVGFEEIAVLLPCWREAACLAFGSQRVASSPLRQTSRKTLYGRGYESCTLDQRRPKREETESGERVCLRKT